MVEKTAPFGDYWRRKRGKCDVVNDLSLLRSYMQTEYMHSETSGNCQIVCKGQRSKDGTGMVSSMILCAVSPLLGGIIPPPGEDREDVVIILPDWPLDLVNLAIRYICTGSIDFSDRNYVKFEKLACLLGKCLGVAMNNNDHTLQLKKEPDGESDDDENEPIDDNPSDKATDVPTLTTSHTEVSTLVESKESNITNSSPAASDLPTCDVCGHTFKMNFHLNRHKKTAHKDNVPQNSGPLNTEDATNDVQTETEKPLSLFNYFEDEKWLKCPICNVEILNSEIFRKTDDFVDHLFYHSPFVDLVNKHEPYRETYKCDNYGCQIPFDQKSEFLQHKYGGCKYSKTNKCGPSLRCNNQLINFLKKCTLGELKCLEEIFQKHERTKPSIQHISQTEETENIDQELEEISQEVMEEGGLSRRFSYSTCDTNRSQSRADSTELAELGDVEHVKCNFCKTVFKSQRHHDRAADHECINQPPEVLIEEDPKPDSTKKISHECKVCVGHEKPVLIDNINLMRHYLIGHYQNFFKRNKNVDLKIEKFPWTCTLCKKSRPWEEELKNWEDVILHIGITHEKLWYALKHDRKNEMRYVQKTLFPVLDKKIRSKRSSGTPVKSGKRSVSGTPGKRRNSETSTERHLNTETSNPTNQNIPPKRRRKSAPEVSSPVASDVEEEPLFKRDKRSVEATNQDGLSNSSKKLKSSLRKSISDAEEGEEQKHGHLNGRVSEANWEDEMNRAGPSSTSDDPNKKKKGGAGAVCKVCDETFPTRAIMQLHTCESLLDQRDLSESHPGSRKARSSSSTVFTPFKDVENNCSTTNKPSKNMAEARPETPHSSSEEVILEPVIRDNSDIFLSPVSKTGSDSEEESSYDEEQNKGEKEKGSNSPKSTILLPDSEEDVSNDEDQDEGETENESNSSKCPTAVGIEPSDEAKCDNCPAVLPNQRAKKLHMKCRHCRKTCVDIKTHSYCSTHEKCYSKGKNNHYVCSVCEKCHKTESERDKCKSGHGWEDYG